MLKNFETLMQEYEKHLGSQPFISITKLYKLGLFGSQSGLYQAIRQGEFPLIRISKKRQVISRTDAIEFFRKKLQLTTKE